MAYRYYSTLRPLMVGGIPFPKQPGESKGIKSATAYKIEEFARQQGYLE